MGTSLGGTTRRILGGYPGRVLSQLLSNGIMTIEYIRSKENIADPLTKGLTREQVSKSSRGMGLKPMH